MQGGKQVSPYIMHTFIVVVRMFLAVMMLIILLGAGSAQKASESLHNIELVISRAPEVPMFTYISAEAYLFYVYGLIADVTFFKQTPPPGHVVAGDVVTIQCEATADSVYWRANLSRIYSSSEVFHVSTSVGSDVWNTTLSTNATIGINNTKITCHASGSSLQQADKKFTYIILASKIHIIVDKY